MSNHDNELLPRSLGSESTISDSISTPKRSNVSSGSNDRNSIRIFQSDPVVNNASLISEANNIVTAFAHVKVILWQIKLRMFKKIITIIEISFAHVKVILW